MVSIIKNQILKHLSKFTKNLSTDKINLSTFKGEGELSDLELDETVLTDLLELPSWLKLTSATCNRVLFRVQWAKLKSVPILLNLDVVDIRVETCSELRATSELQGLSSYAGAAKYTFIHKVIDGITVQINTVHIQFLSHAFTASVELSRILVESKSPEWKRAELPKTRIKGQGQVLLFKELVWQNVRIEAKSTRDPNLTPLRLLTNQARCRISLKKRTSDSFILGSRLALVLEDLLWVLTDSQLKAALHFLDSLAGLIQKSTEETRKTKAARKLEVLPEYQAQQSQSARTKDQPIPPSTIFGKCDVIETSYHFVAEKINLHFSDDPGSGRSCHPELKNGGAFQVSLESFRVDYYPYHLAIADRRHWPTYKENDIPHTDWLREAQTSFTSSLLNLIDEPRHPPLSRTQWQSESSNDLRVSSPQDSQPVSPSVQGNLLKTYISRQMNKLMTSCLIIRMADFNLFQVTTTGSKKEDLKKFIFGDKESYSFLKDQAALHAEFTYYYFPGDDPFPLPTPKFYVLVNPIQIHFDVITLLWLNSFLLNLHQSLLQTAAGQEVTDSGLIYFDVKIEAILPRLVFESAIDHPGQKDRPRSLHLQVSRAFITNVRSADQTSRANLEKCIDSFQLCSLFFNGDFPSLSTDFPLVTEKFIHHVTGSDNVRSPPQRLNANSIPELKGQLHRDMLWTEAKDVWCVHLDPVFGDFFGTRAVGKDHALPFLDAFPLTLWVYLKMPKFKEKHVESNDEKSADIHVLAHVSTLVSVQINHYQYLFLLRLSEEAQELAAYLAIDSNRIVKKSTAGSLVIGTVLPQLELTLVMPSQSPGKESSGGDVESVIPDSSSLQDDVTATGHWPSSNSVMNPTFSTEKYRNSIGELSIDAHPSMPDHVLPPSLPAKTANGNARMQLNLNNTMQRSENTFSFKSLLKNVDNFVNQSLDFGNKNSPEDQSDTMSIRSDISSDSENFVVIANDCSGGTMGKFTDIVESMFKISGSGPANVPGQTVEVATEVIEEENTLTSPSERDSFASYCKRRDLVSISTFKLGKVEFLQQSEGLSSAIKIQVSNLGVEECSSIPWDEFQTKFSARSRDWMKVPFDAGVHPKVKLRLNHHLKQNCGFIKDSTLVDRSTVLKWFENTVNVRLQTVNLTINASTLTGLTDLVEDEVYPTPLPVTIFLEDVKLHINEDRPPCNITSPGPIPLDVVITKLVLHRNAAGVIEIQPASYRDFDRSENENREAGTNKRLLLEVEELRRRLAALEGLSEENYRLKKEQLEVEAIRSKLNAAENRIDSLLENKKKLLDRLSNLEELHQTERNTKR